MGELSQGNCLSECPPSDKIPTIGEEFVEWAEKYWHLKEKYNVEEKPGVDEGCPYDHMKYIFSVKIDNLIKDRLAL